MEQPLTLLVGLPGQGTHFAIDPLSALFLALLAPQVVAVAIAGRARSGLFWGLVLAMALTLLAADDFTLILGFGLMQAAFWLMVRHAGGDAARLGAGAIVSGLCLIPALFLPPGGLAFVLLLLAVGVVAGLAARPTMDNGAMLGGGIVVVALYVLLRQGLVVLAPAAAPWWGVVLALAGGAAALGGGLRALLATEMETVLASAGIAQIGQIATGLGIALWAKALGAPVLAALALQAMLFAALAQALVMPLLWLGVDAVREATGTTSLDWLGGLLRGMPRLGLLMLVGAAGLAALPLGPGFPALFLLLHAVIAGAAAGGIPGHLGFAVLAAALALGVALTAFAALRLIGIGFLGRPRSLRAAAAEEAPRPVLIGMALLAAFCAAAALLPGLILLALQPVVALLAAGAPALPLRYAPLPLALLLLAAGGAAWGGLRRFAARGLREARPWNGGFGKPPIWLPFGDPMTQPTGTGFAALVAQLLAPYLSGARPWLAALQGWRLPLLARRRLSLRQNLAIGFAALLAGLLAIGIGV